MKKVTRADLKQQILSLEMRLADDKIAIREGIKELQQSLKPSHMIRKAAQELSAAPDFKNNLMTLAMSLGAGFLSKKFVSGSSAGPVRSILGMLVQAGVTKLVSNNADGIKSAGLNLLNKLFSKQDKEAVL